MDRMYFLELLSMSILISTAVYFMYCLAKKWGVWQKIDVRLKKRCMLCIFFWVCLIATCVEVSIASNTLSLFEKALAFPIVTFSSVGIVLLIYNLSVKDGDY